MSIRNVSRKSSVYAKLVAYLVKQVVLALSEMGSYGYIKTKDIRAWVLRHLADFIPTKIDDAIINTAIKIDDKTVNVLDKFHDVISDKLKDNSQWDNLILELNYINEDIKTEKANKAKDKALDDVKKQNFNEQLKKERTRQVYGIQPKEEEKEEFQKARQDYVGQNKSRDQFAPRLREEWKTKEWFP